MTNTNQTVRVTGYVVSSKFGCKMTEKAALVNIESVNGESFRHADSTWMPKSIATDVSFERVVCEEGYVSFQFSATIPTWWLRKLDTRAAWQIAGLRSAPEAQRPY